MRHFGILGLNPIYLIFNLFPVIQAFGQQDPLVAQYQFSADYLNPAATGQHKFIHGASIYRKLWTPDVKGGNSQIFTLSSPINYDRFGIGLRLIKQKIVAEEFLTIGIQGSYRIHIAKGYLSMGLGLGINQYRINWDELTIKDPNDPKIGDKTNYWNPDFNWGLHFQNPDYYVGVSIAHLSQSYTDIQNRPIWLHSHYYAFLGRSIKMNNRHRLILNGMLRALRSELLIEGGLLYQYQESFWTGLGLRSNQSITWQMGVQLKPILPFLEDAKLAYAFDYQYGDIDPSFRTSHEILFVFGINRGKSLKNIQSQPRFISPMFF